MREFAAFRSNLKTPAAAAGSEALHISPPFRFGIITESSDD
jgi:hypothetical protein